MLHDILNMEKTALLNHDDCVLCHAVAVFPVVPVSTSCGHPTSEDVRKEGSWAAGPLVCWTGLF